MSTLTTSSNFTIYYQTEMRRSKNNLESIDFQMMFKVLYPTK